MARALWFLFVLGLLVIAAVWLADNPGSVTLHWQDYRLDTSVALLLVAVALIAAAAAAAYRLWRFIRRAPASLSRAGRERRRRRGYLALTQGLVAVAAGDAEEARHQVKRADGLLDDPPLTLLLSAQAAQLAGDEGTGGKYFAAMLDRPETEFLGLRGLLIQAIKRGDRNEALGLARRAYGLKPKSAWVASNLFALQTGAGLWADAETTLARSVRNTLVEATEGRRRRAVLAYQRSLEAGDRERGAEALKRARAAHGLDPGFIPAAVRLARLLIGAGRARKAAAVIEDTWSRAPHADLLDAYWAARGAADGLEKVHAAERLAKFNPDHVESHLAMAAAALEAPLWGEARKHLEAAGGTDPSARVCRLMAALEESEHENMARAHEWLMRASVAERDPAWVCEHCGNAVAQWSALCGKCDGFDSFAWRMPPRVAVLAAGDAGTPAPAALPAAPAQAE